MRTLARATVALALVVASLAIGAGDASANHSWGGYHWARTANPFTLQLGNNMTASWQTYLTTASSDWSSTANDGPTDSFGNVVKNPLRTTIVAGTAKGRCQPTSGTVQVCDASYGANGWLGLAQIWLSNGHIVQGTTKMNDTYFKTSTYNNPNEKAHVVCQEIGHTFGLDHQSTTGADLNTCMDYFSNTGANATNTDSTHPNLHDYGELTLIYSHLDGYNSFTSGAAAPSKPAAAPGLASDGTPVGASPAKGRVYVTDLPDGGRIVTWIRWAD
jgi:hypothetical protein